MHAYMLQIQTHACHIRRNRTLFTCIPAAKRLTYLCKKIHQQLIRTRIFVVKINHASLFADLIYCFRDLSLKQEVFMLTRMLIANKKRTSL